MRHAGPGGDQKLPVRLAAGYASGDMGLNIFWQGISLFLFFFYTDVMGLSVGWAGFTIFIASVWDAVTDPVMGGIADRTRTRFGRYRPFLAFGTPALAMSFAAVFFAPEGISDLILVAYALATHLVMRSLYTVVSIPYSSLSARITSDSMHRSTLAGWRMQAAALGGLTTAISTPGIVRYMSELAGGDLRTGWFLSAVAMAITATIIIWFCALVVREPQNDKPTTATSGVDLKDILIAITMLKRNGPLVRIFIAITMASLCLSMMSKTLVYWFKYSIGDEAAVGPALAISPLAVFFLAPFWAWIAKRWSKRTAFISGCFITLAGYALFLLLPMTDKLTVYGTLGLISVGGAAFAVMYWAMLPDTVEYDEWIAGERHEAMIFGFAAFAQKAALGLNALFLGLMLDWIGFKPNAVQTQETLLGMKMIMTVVPIIGVVATIAALWRYPIDTAFHNKLLVDLKQRGEKPS
jgi:GPH family glycoside/pentoside/hexuronide:cation symporter